VGESLFGGRVSLHALRDDPRGVDRRPGGPDGAGPRRPRHRDLEIRLRQARLDEGAGLRRLGDAQGRDGAPYYSTIRLGDIDGDGTDELIGRGPGGVEVWGYDTDIQDWLPLEGTIPLTDALGWSRPEYYETIRVGDVNHDRPAKLVSRSGLCLLTWGYDPGSEGNNVTGDCSAPDGYPDGYVLTDGNTLSWIQDSGSTASPPVAALDRLFQQLGVPLADVILGQHGWNVPVGL
jgi:hypothetical protein